MRPAGPRKRSLEVRGWNGPTCAGRTVGAPPLRLSGCRVIRYARQFHAALRQAADEGGAAWPAASRPAGLPGDVGVSGLADVAGDVGPPATSNLHIRLLPGASRDVSELDPVVRRT